MTYDVARIRGQFPALAEGAAHFDGPGGTQTPRIVARAVADTLTAAVSNRGVVTRSERRAEEVVGACRAALSDLLGADTRGIVFGRSATALTYDLSRAIARSWQPGDEVVVSRLDHDANVRPWVQAAEAHGATLRWLDFDPETGELTADDVRAILSDRTRLVALTAASNLIGTRPPLREIADAVHAVGAKFWVDGVHATAHVHVDLAEFGADAWTCSPYKFLGPHCGVAAADPEWLETLTMDKLLPSTNVIPERFELGTLPYELMAGTTAAIDFLSDLTGEDDDASHRRDRLRAAYAALEEHEATLLSRLEPALRALPGVRLYSNAARRTPTLLFTVAGRDSQEIRHALAERHINAPAGHFYAIETSRHLGLGDEGGVRVGLAPYTNADDVERLITALTEILG